MESTNVTPDDWEEQLVHYSIGAMEPQEAELFSAALEQCRNRAQVANTYRQVVGLIGAATPAAEPPVGHKARLLDRLAATPQAVGGIATARSGPVPEAGPSRGTGAARPTLMTSRAWGWGAAAAAALLLALSAWLVVTMGTVAQQSERIAQAEDRIEALQTRVNIPTGFRTIALAPTAEYTGVSAVVLFDPESSEAWLVADGLEPLPDDFIYELWLIRPQNQGPSEVGGVFGSSDSGSAVHRTDAQRPIADYAGFAVSIERKPGVTTREGPVVVVGRFEGQ
jgi:anti-sigma-K factor RskA